MDNKAYIMMCEQMGVDIDPNRLMTQFSDFPLVVQNAILVYSKLPDLYVSRGMDGSIFGGKDYSAFASICRLFDITSERDIRTALFVCSYVEDKAVLKAQAALNKDK
ncbi:tail assembly chaperone [Vibrio phage D239]